MPKAPSHTPQHTLTSSPTLEQLLRRQDIWRGHSKVFIKQPSVATGHEGLDAVLQHKGWPKGCLIEVCQRYHACEWLLFHPGINALAAASNGHTVLINPPALPYLAGLQQMNIATQHLLVVQTTSAQEFITSFTELSKCTACCAVLAWQPKQALSYTELRKLQLSTQEQAGMYVIFRHVNAMAQSSPASLRLCVTPLEHSINVHIFKQKGKWHTFEVNLAAPPSWQAHPQYRDLSDPAGKRRRSMAPAKKVYPFSSTINSQGVAMIRKQVRQGDVSHDFGQ
ncbi:MAG: protein ImuA [Lentisphaeria bacterium]|jgi:protein ImuA